MTKEEKVHEILKRLGELWPNPKSELQHKNALQLLIATMLSAQTTDKLVNLVTPDLFAKYKTAKDFAQATTEDIYQLIRKVNFAGTKAKNIQKTAALLLNKFDGNVPDTMEQLITLPGVARKTANVVLGDIFGKQEGIVVDTHVIRLSQRLGLTNQTKPEKIEIDLIKIVPKKEWNRFAHCLILYGRYKCPARMATKDCPILTDLFVA